LSFLSSNKVFFFFDRFKPGEAVVAVGAVSAIGILLVGERLVANGPGCDVVVHCVTHPPFFDQEWIFLFL